MIHPCGWTRASLAPIRFAPCSGDCVGRRPRSAPEKRGALGNPQLPQLICPSVGLSRAPPLLRRRSVAAGGPPRNRVTFLSFVSFVPFARDARRIGRAREGRGAASIARTIDAAPAVEWIFSIAKH